MPLLDEVNLNLDFGQGVSVNKMGLLLMLKHHYCWVTIFNLLTDVLLMLDILVYIIRNKDLTDC